MNPAVSRPTLPASTPASSDAGRTSTVRAAHLRVAVAVITYQRPKGLARLLRGLHHLTFEQIDAPAVTLVVVDNDPAGPARALCERLGSALRWPVRYVVEPRRGIPQARNRAVREAGNVDFIAFIDDDEAPAPDWLEQLLLVQHQHGADVVTGPVLPRYPDEAGAWIVKGPFFEGRRYPTSTPIRFFATNNLLIRTNALHGLTGPFDERLALTGGSDIMLARHLDHRGCRMVWADEAVVYEWIPPTRLRVGWILKHAFRCGNSFSLTDVYSGAGALKQLGRGLNGVRLVLQGLLTFPLRAVTGRSGAVRALCTACYGAGDLAGLFGYRYEEYRRVHGE